MRTKRILIKRSNNKNKIHIKGKSIGKTAKLIIDDKTYHLPIIEGTEGEKAINILKLRQDASFITLDPGFANTAAADLYRRNE